MSGFVRGFGGVLGALAIVGVGAGMAYGISMLAGGSSPADQGRAPATTTTKATADPEPTVTAPSTATPAADLTYTGNLLLTSNRDRLAVCVQGYGVDPSVEAEAVSVIAATMAEATKHANWSADLLGSKSPIVDQGCPSPPILKSVNPPPFRYEPRNVAMPNYYKISVYVLPAVELDPWLTASDYRITGEEILCGGTDNCFEASKGVYLKPSDLGRTDFVLDTIEKAVGLEPPS